MLATTQASARLPFPRPPNLWYLCLNPLSKKELRMKTLLTGLTALMVIGAFSATTAATTSTTTTSRTSTTRTPNGTSTSTYTSTSTRTSGTPSPGAITNAPSDAATKAQAAAKTWLALVDSGKYADSWNQAAAVFKASVTSAGWQSAIKSARVPLGAVKARTLKGATFTHNLPNAPVGDYVVIQYSTSFANRPGSLETITPMKQADGSWKVAGYYIK